MKFVLTLLVLIGGFFAWSQGDQTGIILDKKSNPIAGAYVVHLSSERHAHTDIDGRFVIRNVEIGDSLEVLHVGYEKQRIAISDLSSTIKIKLEEKIFSLDEVVVGFGTTSVNKISDINLAINPVKNSQELLRVVPGLFIGQHAGGGKAEQIFLRGFDIDHGTDVSISVDGLPVNMVSHAHGQGYSDMHFIIPETIEKVDFDKGPYNAQYGNFATAGYIDFRTKRTIEDNMFKSEIGMFNTFRNVGMFNLVNAEKHNAYAAAEYILTDGFFDASQNFNRINLFGKYTGYLSNNDMLSITVSHFESKWDASGQIPVRAVNEGLISPFGAIDDTEGGYTSRNNIQLEHVSNFNDNTFLVNKAYFSTYDFELYSNFTFFLEDPVNGDQIRQREDRQLYGFSTEINNSMELSSGELRTKGGIGMRYDNSDENELSWTRNRLQTLRPVQFGDIDETNLFGYVNFDFEFDKWLINPGIRVDYFDFEYYDRLDSTYSTQNNDAAAVSPKLNIIYNWSRDFQIMLKTGIGFHSNDARVVLDNSADKILPAAYGADLGFTWKPFPRLVVNSILWYLFLEQEFVYVGDAGIVEPSGESVRKGIDLSVRYQLLDGLFFDGDLNLTDPRSIEEADGEDFIPLAPTLTAIAGASYVKSNFTASLRSRYLGDRAANEDNSIVAEGYFVVDANATYSIKNFTFGVNIENLLDVDWKETQFATESRYRLPNGNLEPTSTEEIHFIPGTPFNARGFISFTF